jgi:hypothetical protein
MYKKIANGNLILNSNKELVSFQLGKHGELKYNLYDPSHDFSSSATIYEKNILKYSTIIDSKDSIHLIILMKSGELIHSIYENGYWSNKIVASFDTKSNLYSHMDILIVSNTVNIIYNYANLINSNIWTFQHIVDDKINWEKYNIIRYISDSMSPFYIDTDASGIIHILYRGIEDNLSHIYHTFYNPFAKGWNQIPQRLSSKGTDNFHPYLFIDTKDTIHGLWLEKKDLDYVLKYSQLMSKGQEKYIWNQISIPHISKCINTPLIFEEKGILKIIYLTNDSIGCLYSLDYGNSWNKGNIEKINLSSINFAKISNNLSSSNNLKINHIYFSTETYLNFYFVDTLGSINKINESSNSCNIHHKKSTDKIQSPKSDNIHIIKMLEPKIEQLLLSQIEIKNILYEISNRQKSIEEKIENMPSFFNEKKDSLFTRLFNKSK